MNPSHWEIADPPPEETLSALGNVAARFGELPARLLINRGIRDAASAARFLNPRYQDLGDPFALPDMPAGVDRVISALEQGERIGVLGDFDVDGLSAAALLVHTLRSFGGHVTAHIPTRVADGHGLSIRAIDSFAENGVSVLITADTGTTDISEVEYANRLGIDCVITDHHLPGDELPRARAIINPQCGRPVPGMASLSGSGVAFKFAQAVGRSLKRSGANDALALAALGTIADAVPLTGDNRIIAAAGLDALNRTRHAGLGSLLASARQKIGGGPIDTEAVSFHIAPRLNAPGRLGDPKVSLDLLTCDDTNEADRLAAEIDALNTERQRLSRLAWTISTAQLSKLDELPPLISIVARELSPGILGPLAGRLCEEYRRPAVAVTFDGDAARGSARSVPGFDLHAALAQNSELLTRYGGHSRAAGFTLPADRLDTLLEALREQAAALVPTARRPALKADAEVGLPDLDARLWDFVDTMAPFGEGNQPPLFLTRHLVPTQVATVGAAGEHLRLVLDSSSGASPHPVGSSGRRPGGGSMSAIGFRLGGADLGTGLVDALYALRTSYWKGRRKRELELKAIRPSAG